MKAVHSSQKFLVIFCLILAGEMIFGLPFHVVRYFRPTFMAVFNMNNAQLGDAMAIYGVTAMASYFPGGILADRFSARDLMSLSLFATGLGGLYLLTIPGQIGLTILFGYWGVTTILLFWSAMIRATREWGGRLSQGKAFGFLDGGRGLIASVMATGGVYLLSHLLPTDLESIGPNQRIKALQGVILFYTALTLITAFLIRLFIPSLKIKQPNSKTISGVLQTLKNTKAWLQAIIVISAYCGYRGLDFYGLYGVDVLGMDEVSSARFVSLGIYLRPVGAIAAGFLADRFTTKKILSICFFGIALSYVLLTIINPIPGMFGIIMANLIFTFLVVYALRGIYFALFEEMNVSGVLTGTTVGLVSFIGYTPDIFFNSIGGRILDASPGIQGYHNFFLFLVFFAVIGLIATLVLTRLIRKDN